eukprot:6484645-Amphidinium_carterae.1
MAAAAAAPMLPTPDSDQVMLGDLSPLAVPLLEFEHDMSDEEPLTPLAHAALAKAKAKAKAKPMVRVVEERSAPP